MAAHALLGSLVHMCSSGWQQSRREQWQHVVVQPYVDSVV